MPTKTFWLEPTGSARLGLRRYSVAEGEQTWTCDTGFHEALVWLEDTVQPVYNDDGYQQPPPDQPRDHPAWPVECDRGCGYRFTPDDTWQTWQEPLYRRTDTGELRVLHWKFSPPGAPTAEPGAMWDAPWMRDTSVGLDGISLVVRLPHPAGTAAHDWTVDGPSSTGGHWARTGDPRQANVTVSPSIASGAPGTPDYYHGFLRGGVLTDHIG